MNNNERDVHQEMNELGLSDAMYKPTVEKDRTREVLLTRVDQDYRDAQTFKLVAVGSTENPEDGVVTVWQIYLDGVPDEIFILMSDDYRVLRVKGINNPNINDSEMWKRELNIEVEDVEIFETVV